MKKLIALIFTAILFTGVHAQKNKEDVDLIQDIYGKEKKELVIEYMKFNPTDEKAFWTVYDEFEKERKVLGSERIKIISDYADKFAALNDSSAKELGTKTLENNVALEKLNQKYFPRFSTAIGAVKAAKYMQLELYLQTTVRSVIQDEIPFIEEMDKSKKSKK